jgi:ABC-2 type transport system ATP-binding protein
MNILDCNDLGVRYRSGWALRGCSFSIPEGHVVGLVGPNGAGKSTLLHCVVGLLEPTAGKVTVLGGERAGSRRALEGVGFVAQDAPLYRHLSVNAMIALTAALNGVLDEGVVGRRLDELKIPRDAKVGKLSGGQQAQLALTLAIGRRPGLLVLDEPLARLDPLARHSFMSLLMAAVTDGGLSVIFSTHVVSELERVADYLVLVTQGRLRMVGAIDDLLDEHRVLVGPVENAERAAAELGALQVQRAGRQAHLLVRCPQHVPPAWEAAKVGLEELVLAYMAEPSSTPLEAPTSLGLVGEERAEVAR